MQKSANDGACTQPAHELFLDRQNTLLARNRCDLRRKITCIDGKVAMPKASFITTLAAYLTRAGCLIKNIGTPPLSNRPVIY